jgi:nitrate reductase gamma subunit
MELLQFARGPALTAALAIFAFGVLWRLGGILLLEWRRIPSPPREGAPAPLVAALQGVVGKMWPHEPFVKPSLFSLLNGYLFHIGLAIAVLLFAPHIQFFKSLFGFSWPALPSNVVLAVSVITAASLVAALVHRLTNPVQRLISRVDDYLSWALTVLPVITGIAAVAHIGGRYETVLAVHILTVCAFLIWFPFGKLMHAFLIFASRGASGVRFKHRGAEA